MSIPLTVRQLITILRRVPEQNLPCAIETYTENGDTAAFALPQNIYTTRSRKTQKKHLVFSELPPEETHTTTQELLAIHHP